MNNQYLSILPGQPLSADVQKAARGNAGLISGFVPGIASRGDPAVNAGRTLLCGETKCAFFSNGVYWEQCSIGTFTYAEVQAFTMANWNGIRGHCSTYRVDFIGDGTACPAVSPFTIERHPNSADTVTGDTAERIIRPFFIPGLLLPETHAIYASSAFAAVAGGSTPRMRINNSNSLVSASANFFANNSTTSNTWDKTIVTSSTSSRTGGGATTPANAVTTSAGMSSAFARNSEYYVLLTTQLTVGTDIATLVGYNIEARP